MKLFLSGHVLLDFSILFQIFCPVLQGFSETRKYHENLKISQKYRLVLSPPPKMKICQHQEKHSEKQKLNFCCSRLFNMKTRVCLKYHVNDCTPDSLDAMGLMHTKNKVRDHVCAQKFRSNPKQKTRYDLANLCIIFSIGIYKY